MAPRHQSGFSLIEVMIAVVVLSLGLLGVAGLQLSSVRNTQGSYLRSQAVVYMNDLAERIYSNSPGVLTYSSYTNVGNCAAPAQICARESTTGTVPAVCTPAQMATYDLFAVACGMPNGTGRAGGVVNALPGGQLQTTCTAPCTATTPITITVNWTDTGSSGNSNANAQSAGTPQVITLVVQP